MIRTPEQYVESLRDGRVIFLDGEKIPDITKHPSFKGSINARAYSYALCNHPQFKDLLTAEEDAVRHALEFSGRSDRPWYQANYLGIVEMPRQHGTQQVYQLLPAAG